MSSLCLVCAEEGAELVAWCDGNEQAHAMCRDCAGRYLTETVFSRSSVPKWGQHIACAEPACLGVCSIEMLLTGLDEPQRRRVQGQIARSTIRDAECAYNIVWCDRCEECYFRDGPGDSCFRCAGAGQITAMYTADGDQQPDPATSALIRNTSIPCPACGININRTGGCNHMTCTRCSKEFCYGCGDEWDSNRCGYYTCRLARQYRARQGATMRARTRADREEPVREEPGGDNDSDGDSDDDGVCHHCSLRGVRGRCPHIALMPRQASCAMECPRACHCPYSEWIRAWLEFRPSPGAEQDLFEETAIAKLNVAHAAVTKTRGTICRVCGLRGHNPGSQSGGRHCPLLALVDHRASQETASGRTPRRAPPRPGRTA
eukprot:jgi/Tetstr1/454185/TSEL_041104.t1